MSVGRGEGECRVQSVLNSPQPLCVSAFQRVRDEGGRKNMETGVFFLISEKRQCVVLGTLALK